MLGTILTIASGVGTGIGIGWLAWGANAQIQPAGALSSEYGTDIDSEQKWLLSRALIGPIPALENGIAWRSLYNNRIGFLEHSPSMLRMRAPRWGILIIRPMNSDEMPRLIDIGKRVLMRYDSMGHAW